MSKVNISIEQLFELGAHFGHRKRFWNPHMEDYIFCEKNNIHIIDLYKTQEKIIELYEIFRKLSSVGNKVMIVGTKRVASSYVSEFGEKTGDFVLNITIIDDLMYLCGGLSQQKESNALSLTPCSPTRSSIVPVVP